MKTLLPVLTMVGLLLALASVAYAGDIYIAQSATGSDSGTDCANAHSAPWFNANATGGNTYHLCGTFTGTAGSTMLTPPNSGSSGNIVTILNVGNTIITAYQPGNNNYNADHTLFILDASSIQLEIPTKATSGGSSRLWRTFKGL